MCFFFFFNDTATTEIYTLSLHDALPICAAPAAGARAGTGLRRFPSIRPAAGDRKSTRLNSSHLVISYAVFCLKKKKKEDMRAIKATITQMERSRLHPRVHSLYRPSQT